MAPRKSKIAKIIAHKKYNLHSHTEFCDGRATMEAFARKAIEEGFGVYGFSPHSPVPVVSPCNMRQENVDRFIAEVKRLNLTYGDRCRFLAGMEIDYLGKDWGPSTEYFQSLPLDYRIGSIHFLPNQTGELVDCDGSHESFQKKLAEKFDGDLRYVVETYYNQLIGMIKKRGFDILGHFDKIADNASFCQPGIEDEQWYIKLEDKAVSAVPRSGMVVELNTKVYAERHRLFPSLRIVRKLLERNIEMIVNSDAHVPALINASREDGLLILSEIAESLRHD